MYHIPGWPSELELDILKSLASNVPENGSILEIGSFLGRSTLALFQGKKESVSLDVVDTFQITSIFSPTEEFKDIRGDLNLFKTAKNIAIQTGNWKKSFEYCLGDFYKDINVNVVESQTFEIKKTYDLIFIDADHSYKSVSQDLKKYSSPNTLIIGDDFSTKYPSVAIAVLENRQQRSLVVLKNTKFFIIFPENNSSWMSVVEKFI